MDWINEHFSNMNICDVDYTMEKYDFPEYVRLYIINNWIKISDNNGGTYIRKKKYPDL